MRAIKYLLFCLFILFNHNLFAQLPQNQWVWIDGSKNTQETGSEFGLVGIEDITNWPYARTRSSGITTNDGNLLLFGGRCGYNPTNELWSYNPTTNIWNYKKGSIYRYSLGKKFSKGVGIEHYRNKPNITMNTPTWKDNNGNLWVFAGNGNYGSSVVLNSLWKYNVQTNNWIEVYSGTAAPDGNYGIQGVESPTNIPPATSYATTWTDTNGNFWMYGGEKPTNVNDSFPSFENYSALWRYNLTTGNWTWMSGLATLNAPANYAVLGSASAVNFPGKRSNAAGWSDNTGNLYLFGGVYTNDIWKYTIATNLWTWVKGSATSVENVVTVDSENPNNLPIQTASDKAFYWKDNLNRFWYYDGTANNRMWMYNPLTNNWILKKQAVTAAPIHGTMGVSNATNTPGRRYLGTTWTANNGDLYLFSGGYSNDNPYNDFWKYSITNNQWTWVKGFPDNSSIPSIASPSHESIKLVGIADNEINPGWLTNYCAKWNDADGNLWVFGILGEGYEGSNSGDDNYHDLWKYNSSTKQWQWIKGLFDYPRYSASYDTNGQLGVENYKNNPLARQDSMSWVDASGNLWLFGGFRSATYNDLWKFNKATNNWVRIGGSLAGNQFGNYGQQGVTSPTNWPGSRGNGVTWVDNAGIFWLYGGRGFASSGNSNGLNDLWKYDSTTNLWTWVKGSNLSNQAEVSAGIGIESPTNNPQAAIDFTTNWKDNSGNCWLFIAGHLWKFSNNNWTKMKAAATSNYGTMGIYADTNAPGPRKRTTAWTDTDGNLLFFGGEYNYDKYQDLWKYNIALNNWSWVGGKKYEFFGGYDPKGNYGQLNQYFISNVPGGRINSVNWKDNSGNLYLYGGEGWDETVEGSLSDVWQSNRNFNFIAGNVKYNSNNNNCLNSTVNVPNTKIKILENGIEKITFTNATGNYIEAVTSTSVLVTPELPYFSFNPNNQTLNFTGFGGNQNANFCASATGTFNDLEVTIIPIQQARPGINIQYKLLYKNKGTSTLSGNLQFNYEDNLMDFIVSNPAPTSQSTNNLTWNYTNLAPFESRYILITLNINTPTETPPVNAGDILDFTAVIQPTTNDLTLNDNTFNLHQTVVNSVDPNDKNCLEGTTISPAQVGSYVNYIIRFENTGTANAFNIVVTDFIDASKFDLNSILPVDASHNYRLTISQTNKLEFIFENINLPFPPSALRYGYVVFKIKTKTTLSIGDTFSNSANIYFDYNFPIVTNNYITTVQTLGTDLYNENNKLIVYPNPVKDVVTFKTNSQVLKVEIYDVSGRIISSNRVTDNKLDVSQLNPGSYILKLYSENVVVNTKILKE